VKSFSSREFNQDVSSAKRLAREEPVFVTDRGRPTHVLLSIEAYRQLVGKPESLADLLAGSEPISVDPDWRALGPWGRGA
jgi:prevent-host-death family protein